MPFHALTLGPPDPALPMRRIDGLQSHRGKPHLAGRTFPAVRRHVPSAARGPMDPDPAVRRHLPAMETIR